MNKTVMLLIALPLLGALIGWFTNYLAVKMIFRPRRPIRLLGIAGLTFHGLLPKRRTEFADSIADTIQRELISHDDIAGVLTDEENQERLLGFVEKHADRFMRKKLDDLNPLIMAFLPLDFAKKMKDGLMAELRRVLPDLMDEMTEQLETKIDFKQIVHDRIEAVPVEKLEQIVVGIAKKELRAIEILGGVLGFLIGLAQFLVVYLIA